MRAIRLLWFWLFGPEQLVRGDDWFVRCRDCWRAYYVPGSPSVFLCRRCCDRERRKP